MIVSPDSSAGSRSAIVLSTAAAGTMSQTARGFLSFLARSASEELPTAFSLARSWTAFWDMSKTTHSWPPARSLRTILAPIRPRPTIPSCMTCSFRWVEAFDRGSTPLRFCRRARRLRFYRCARLRCNRGRQLGGRRLGSRAVLPHEESAPEGIGVVALPASRRQLLQQSDVASAEHNIVGLERGGQPVNHVKNVLAPLFLAEPLESPLADIVLVRGLLVGEMTELHRLHDPVHDQRRAKPGSQPK